MSLEALPLDPEIDSLSPSLRRAVASVFLGRAASEARAALAFADMAEHLRELDAPGVLHKMAADAVDEEQAHARICRKVAEAYAGCELPPPTPAPLGTMFDDVQGPLRAILCVLLQCAFSETVGNAFLERTRATTTAPIPRAALRLLFADEIDHARIGWGLLASPLVTDELRAQIGGYAVRLCEATVRTWRRRPTLPALAQLGAHGCLPYEEIDRTVLDAMRTLVLPGLATLGIDTRSAEAWLDAVPPPSSTPPLPIAAEIAAAFSDI
jgi:hypothetical protein